MWPSAWSGIGESLALSLSASNAWLIGHGEDPTHIFEVDMTMASDIQSSLREALSHFTAWFCCTFHSVEAHESPRGMTMIESGEAENFPSFPEMREREKMKTEIDEKTGVEGSTAIVLFAIDIFSVLFCFP